MLCWLGFTRTWGRRCTAMPSLQEAWRNGTSVGRCLRRPQWQLRQSNWGPLYPAPNSHGCLTGTYSALSSSEPILKLCFNLRRDSNRFKMIRVYSATFSSFHFPNEVPRIHFGSWKDSQTGRHLHNRIDRQQCDRPASGMGLCQSEMGVPFEIVRVTHVPWYDSKSKAELLVFKAENVTEASYLFCRYGTGSFGFARLISDVTGRFCTPFELQQVGPHQALNSTEDSPSEIHRRVRRLSGYRAELATARVWV